MSSKVAAMAKKIERVEPKTKEAMYRIDVDITTDIHGKNGEMTTYMKVVGIPEDLPESYENTIVHAAEMQFAQALNDRSFLEFYNKGKSAKDGHPVFINMSHVTSIMVTAITKVDN